MSKLVLVNHWPKGIGNNKPPLGLGYLASYLKQYLGFYDIAIINTGERTFEKIQRENPEIVGFSSYSANYPDVCDLMKRVKEEINVPVLIGGAHITCLPHKLPEYADVGVIGEGEETLLDLMRLYLQEGRFNTANLENIKGIAFHDDGKIRLTPPREPIRPLDHIPLPDRELLNMRRFLRPSQILMSNEYLRGATMLSSRGCPFKCVYCCVAANWGRVRLHSATRVVTEIQLLVEKYGVEGIYIEDDLFTSSLKRIQEIINGMDKQGILGKVRFLLDLRANMVTEELMALLERMGVVKISLGLESGSDRILRYLKGEEASVEQNRNAVKIANKYGIGCYCCFMLGAPPETREDIAKTQKLINEILNMSTKNFCQVTVTTPFPGTGLWDYALAKGYVSEDADWRQFSLDLRLSRKRDFYINEHIDFNEFQKTVQETMELCNSRRLESILTNFSFGYVKKCLTQPKLTYQIIRSYLKHRRS